MTETHTTQPAKSHNDSAAVSPQMFTDVLKKTALHFDAEATTATMQDVRRTLRFFEEIDCSTASNARRRRLAMASESDTPATRQEFAAIMATTVPDDRVMTYGMSVKPLLAELRAFDNLRLRFPDVLMRHKAQRLYQRLHQAALTVPGQATAAQELAVDLTNQLSQPKRRATTRVLIHGDSGAGGHELASALADSLVEHEGYQVLHIDCANYRGSGEVAQWIGSKPVWSSSSPGEVTSFIHKYQKAVLVFHHIDETLPKVMGSLRGAMEHGEMIDAYGLNNFGEAASSRVGLGRNAGNGQQTTVVNCREAVFIFTASYAAQWLRHPEVANILGDSDWQRRCNLAQALRDATQVHRNETMAIFDYTVLANLKGHHHILQPIGWQVLHAQAIKNMPMALDLARRAFEQEIGFERPDDEQDWAAMALCQHGADMAIAHTRPEALFDVLFKPLHTQRLVEGSMGERFLTLGLRMGDNARQRWSEISQKMGEDPLHYFRQRREFTELKFICSEDADFWQVDAVELKPVRRLSDFVGIGALISEVPSEKFEDVFGQDAAKSLLAEIVAYLKNPKVLAEWGVQPPRGVVLHGPPGTGKTLLARALAGESGLPFIAVSGSDLLDPAALTRLYDVAHQNQPCIIYIDEIDVLGKRGQHGHAHDVAVNTLLTKIDGFDQRSGIYHVLSTNRTPDWLDPALIRPGRIDRALEIGALDLKGRQACLTRLWPLLETANHSDLAIAQKRIVDLTYGMTGAELTQLHREVVLHLVRNVSGNPSQAKASLDVVLQQINRVRHGDLSPRLIDEAFRKRVALHEAGHALLHFLLLRPVPIAQVSIAPRGSVGGFLSTTGEGVGPVEETASSVRDFITVLMAGRAGELTVFGQDGASSGAGSDLDRASKVAFQAVAYAGLDREFGVGSLSGLMANNCLPPGLHAAAAGRAMAWVQECADEALRHLAEHRDAFDAIVEALLERETLDGTQIAAIVSACNPVEDTHGGAQKASTRARHANLTAVSSSHD